MSMETRKPLLSSGSTDAGRGEQARVAVLGANAWVVAILVPSLHAGLGGVVSMLASVAPLPVLVLGVLALPTRVARARWTLLAAYPAALGAVFAYRPELGQLGALGVALASLSLLAFVAASAHAVGRDRGAKTADTQPLAGKDPVFEPAARRFVRRALLGVSALGALAVTVLAPILGGRHERVARWGEAADDATVLAIVVGAIASAIALGALVGPTLRATRAAREPSTRRAARVATALVLATGAAAGWLALRYLEP